MELLPTVKKEIYSADPGKDRPYFSGLMILLFSGDVMKKLFKDVSTQEPERFLFFVSGTGE